MKQDRFLMGILIFIVALVIAALVLFIVRNDKPAYGPDDRPEDVLYNYAVALQLRDYERAYSYLAEKDNQPSYQAFYQAFLTRQLDPNSSTLQIGDVQVLGDSEAWVEVAIQHAGNGLLDSGWASSERSSLVKQNGAWKITYLSQPYWGWDWYQPTPMPVKQ